MLTIVTWVWRDGGPRAYTLEHAAALAAGFRRHLSKPHRFVCLTDDVRHVEGIDVKPIPQAAAECGQWRTPEAGRFPSCYRRLWMFSEEAAALGQRLLLVDVDALVTGSVDHLTDRSEDFVGWRPRATWGNPCRLGGGLYLLTAGSRRQVWDRFTGPASIGAARAAGFRGSDQAWLSFCLGADAASWPHDSGVYSVRDLRNPVATPPPDACLIQFNGPTKPWTARWPWVREHYCGPGL